MTDETELRAIRKALGISVTEISATLGVSSATFYLYELEKKQIPKNTYAKLIRVLQQKIYETYETAPSALASLQSLSEILAYLQTLETPGTKLLRATETPGERVHALRSERQMTIASFAAFTGIDRTVLSRIESGDSNCTERSARMIGLACHVGYEWILHGIEARRQYPVDECLIQWLWDHPQARRNLYQEMAIE